MATVARIFVAVFLSIFIVFLFIGLLVDVRLIKNADAVSWSVILMAIVLITPIVFMIGKWVDIAVLDSKCDDILQKRIGLVFQNTAYGGTPESREEEKRISEEYAKALEKLGRILRIKKED